MNPRRRFVVAAALLAALVAGAAWLVARLVPLPARLSARHSTIVRWEDGSAAHVFLSGDDKVRVRADLARVDEDFVAALLAREDRRFRWHSGVDPLALVRAAVSNAKHGRIVSGGSTITMQLVRVLEPRPRTHASKIVEALRAGQLEARLSKDEILAAWLTFAPYGRNVEGVEAASLALFGHGPETLSPAEICTLLAIPQRPAQRTPSPENARRLREGRDEIARVLGREGIFGERAEEIVQTVVASDVPESLRAIPREIPHAATWLRARHPDRHDMRTTLRRETQQVVEGRMDTVRADLAAQGVHDGVVVVVEHGSGDVRALAGNFEFFAERAGSQVIGFDAPRSPGSTLKPFLHALAIDRGMALPETLVADVPVSWGAYSPENYAGTFSGLVPLRAALAWSLNVPFVDLLSRYGVERFIGELRGAGAESLSPRAGAYGLSAAIGGVEVTPLEMAALYAALAGDGQVRELRLLADEPPPIPRRFVSAGAAWLTRRVLSLRDRPDFPMRRQFSAAPAHVHWKTGTSMGHRDAWACGSDPVHSVVTWLGNFDRSPSAALVGSEATAPLLFDVLEGLAVRGGLPPVDRPPEELVPVEICTYSGRVPSPACPAKRRVLALRASVPVEPCANHVEIDVDLASGLALSPACREGRTWERRTYLTWPSSVRRFLSRQEQDVPRPPTLMAGCEPSGARRPPAIVSPPSGQVVVLLPGVPAEAQQVPLLAESFAPDARHAWFVNGAYLGATSPEEASWWTPVEGVHELVVVDEAGRMARRRLEVRAAGG